MSNDSKKDLINKLIASKAIVSKRIVSAFKNIDRADFVPAESKSAAYLDKPLPLASSQTISQPTTVGIMTEALEPKPGQLILEIGTGSGFQTAILSEVVGSKGTVVTLERLPLLYQYGKKNLQSYSNVEMFCSDGTLGYPYKAPYDRILVAAEAKKFPNHLFNQLKHGGIIVIPVKGRLLKIQRLKDDGEVTDLGAFSFVPLVGEYE